MNKNTRHQGFTLLELMAALSIIVLITASVYGAFSAGISAWGRAFSEGEALQNARVTLKLLSRDIKSVVAAEPILTKNLGRLSRRYFCLIGGENSLEMICYSRPVSLYWPENFPRRSDICRVTYYFEAIEKGSEISVLKRKVSWDKSVLPWQEEEIEVFEGVTGLQLSYFNGNSWVLEWDTSKKKGVTFHGLLPLLVKAGVTAGSSGSRSGPVYLETIMGVTTYEK